MIGAILSACRQPNPEWLGPADDHETEAASGSTASATEPDDGPDDGGSIDDGPDACAPASISGQGECPAACDGCDGGRCRIACTDERCEYETITCPDGWPCDIVCDSRDACDHAELRCPADRDCTVECSARSACEDATIECGAMPCLVTCHDGNDVCHDLLVRCGATDTQVLCEDVFDVTLEPAEGVCACAADGCG